MMRLAIALLVLSVVFASKLLVERSVCINDPYILSCVEFATVNRRGFQVNHRKLSEVESSLTAERGSA